MSQQTVEEYYQLRESLRPFMEERIGLPKTSTVDDAVFALEQLLDFEEHLQDDPEFFDACAESILLAKCMLAQRIGPKKSERYLTLEDKKKVEKELGNDLYLSY